MKSCELCKSLAKIYCESDHASLCWTCDSKVHSANFLVARHSRSLLCRVCQSPTPWTASGEKLGPSAVSICENCVREEGNDDDDANENQVVPLSYTAPPAASASSSSCGGRGCSVGDSGLVKRKRENVVADLGSEDDVECLSVKKNKGTEGNGRTTLYHFLPLSSEAMGEKPDKSGLVGASKRTRAVGLDLNSSN
ncbi:uncharacterized protein LOC143567087 [Bidens hawaiensis]|uniref:uncharacterized protein LOC143567087 n=1 Tax=Bidens hawaiensis TaxID=980011 RepID=UPI00404A6523